jgi:hypothetical protein
MRTSSRSAAEQLVRSDCWPGTRELQDENNKLRALLGQAQRTAKRQAAPFSKGAPKPHPKPPGRRAGQHQLVGPLPELTKKHTRSGSGRRETNRSAYHVMLSCR